MKVTEKKFLQGHQVHGSMGAHRLEKRYLYMDFSQKAAFAALQAFSVGIQIFAYTILFQV